MNTILPFALFTVTATSYGIAGVTMVLMLVTEYGPALRPFGRVLQSVFTQAPKHAPAVVLS